MVRYLDVFSRLMTISLRSLLLSFSVTTGALEIPSLLPSILYNNISIAHNHPSY